MTRKKRSARLWAGALTLTLAATGTITASIASPETATAATTSIVDGTSTRALARAVNARVFPTGGPAAIVSPSAPSTVLTQAAALASSTGRPLVVSDSPSVATTTIADLSTLGATSVILFGQADSFSAGFKSDVASAVTVSADINAETPFARSVASAGAAPGAEALVVVRAERPVDFRLASAEAIRSGDVLVVLDGSEAVASLQSFFAGWSGKRVSAFGGEDVLPSGVITDAELAYFDPITTIDETSTNRDLASRAMYNGRKGHSVPTCR